MQNSVWQADPRQITVTRFCHHASELSDVVSLLQSLINHLAQATCLLKSHLSVKLREYSEVKEFFLHLLNNLPGKYNVFIFLDAIEEIVKDSEADGFAFDWIPSVLPQNVKIVLSLLPSTKNNVQTIKKFLNLPPENILNIPMLNDTEMVEMLVELMRRKKRTLNKNQWTYVKNTMKDSRDKTPLYLKLVLREIVKWKSYDKPRPIPSSVVGCIMYILECLEKEHGETLVSHSLRYISLTKNGLTEAELEDILSLDEQVRTVLMCKTKRQ